MRLTPQTLVAAGNSPWIIPGALLLTPTVSLAVTFSVDANLTAAVQYTYDDPAQTPVAVAFARAAGVLTVTLNNHGLNVADTIDINDTVLGSWAGPAGAGGNYDVATVVDKNNFTVTVPNAGPAADTGHIRTYKLWVHPVLTGLTGAPPARKDSSLGFQAAAVRLHVTAYTAGAATLTASTGAGY